MHLGKIFSVQSDLAHAHIVEIEVDITKSGLPAFSVVGLPDKAVEESRERVTSAIKNSGYDSPKKFKTVVSLSPAAIKKEGSHYDLPIAVGLLLANGDESLSCDTTGMCFLGELALDGKVRPVDGTLGMVRHAQSCGFHTVFVPQENAQEAALVHNITVYGVESLQELVTHLSLEDTPQSDGSSLRIAPQPTTPYEPEESEVEVDFAHVVDQERAKRAMLIAASGGHNLALYGPAGTGKSMLSKAFAGILPPLSYQQMLECTTIHSHVGVLGSRSHISSPPFRSPHHTSSYVSIIGGGTTPRPGEISLAHNGVLFLDEFPEFDSRVLESLREPMEEGSVHISRAKGSVSFPARSTIIVAMNPPSAVYRDPSTITPAAVRRFSKKISGPIMDRIDLWVEVPKIEHRKLLDDSVHGASSLELQSQVRAARAHQEARLGSERLNAHIASHEIASLAGLSAADKTLMDDSAAQLDLSPRVYHKILKIARTIADLESSPEIKREHILEALSYRPRDII